MFSISPKQGWVLAGSITALLTLLAASSVLREGKVESLPALAQPAAAEDPANVQPEVGPSTAKVAAALVQTKRAAVRPTLQDRLSEFSKMADREQNPAAFDSFVAEWIADLAPSEMPEALAFLQKAGLEKPVAVDLQARLVRQWAGGHSDDALRWVNALPVGPLRELALENVAIVRSQTELTAAAAWASQLPPGEERDRVVAVVVNEAVRTEPAEALRLADNLPATPANDDLIRRAAMEWTAQDSTKALQWAQQIPDESFRAQVLSGVAVAWSAQDPIAAGRLVIDQLPAGRQQDDAIVSIAQRWAQRSPEQAAQWINTFPNGTLKDAAVESVVAIWTQSDPEIAAQWKANLTAHASSRR